MAPRKRRTFKRVLASYRRQDLVVTLTEEATIAGRVQAQIGEKATKQIGEWMKHQSPWERVKAWGRIEDLVNRKIERGIEDCERLLEDIDVR